MATYIAYGCGKMNQSFIMKNENGEPVYEANLTKFRLFGESDFEFVNKLSSKSEPHKVGKTKTTEMGTMGYNFTTASYFKLDGVNVFDILEKKGFHFNIIAKLDLLHPEFALVDQNGNQMATYKLNVLGERQENVRAIGNKQRNTVINTDSDDLETIFLGAFIFSRVDFSAYLV